MALASRFTGLASRTTLNRIPVRKATVPSPAAPASTPLGPQAVTAPSVLPPDANYDASIANSQTGHDINAADLARQRQQALLNAGYTQDATGALAFDPTNPFSQSAMYKRQYDQAARGNTNSYAARGQLYSGALQNAQNESGFQYQAGVDTQQKALLAFLANNTGASAKNDVDLATAQAQAAGARLQAAPDNPLYEPGAAAPAAAPAVSAQDAANAAHGGAPTVHYGYRAPSGLIGTLKVYPDGRKVFTPN